MFTSDLLSAKRILVTGGGTGLGKSMSRRFLELGASVVICGRRQNVLEETATQFASECWLRQQVQHLYPDWEGLLRWEDDTGT